VTVVIARITTTTTLITTHNYGGLDRSDPTHLKPWDNNRSPTVKAAVKTTDWLLYIEGKNKGYFIALFKTLV
jgi:hypothetical protein